MRLSRRRRAPVAPAVTVALLLAGVGCVGAALGSSPAPAPPLAATVQAPAGPPAPGRSTAGSLVAHADLRPAPAAPPVPGPVLPASAPLRLSIPAIGVDSRLLSLGQEPDGTLEVPSAGPEYDQAGWYRYSPSPGQTGPAVIAGHVDSAAAGPSVFFRLSTLQPGDEVLVDRADGLTAVFRVDEVRRYAKDDFPTALVYGDTDHAALRLITCGGRFDRRTGHYVDNIVVTATLIHSRSRRQLG